MSTAESNYRCVLLEKSRQFDKPSTFFGGDFHVTRDAISVSVDLNILRTIYNIQFGPVRGTNSVMRVRVHRTTLRPHTQDQSKPMKTD